MRLGIENGVPRVRQCTAEEEEEFLRTHPNVILPTFSVEEVNRLALRGLEELEKQFGKKHPKSPSPGDQITDPSAVSIVNDPSAR
jgi:hypothetical protein